LSDNKSRLELSGAREPTDIQTDVPDECSVGPNMSAPLAMLILSDALIMDLLLLTWRRPNDSEFAVDA